MMNWYYAEAGKQQGPFEEEAWSELIAAGKIRPETLVWNETMEIWTRFSQVAPTEEVPDVLPPAEPLTGEALEAELTARDYAVNTGDCLRRSWDLLRRNFWRMIGVTALVYAILLVDGQIPTVGTVISLVINGPLVGGLYLYYLKLIRGEPARIEDAFSGFGARFKQLMMANFVKTILLTAFFLPGFIGFFALTRNLSPGGSMAELIMAAAAAKPVALLRVVFLFLVGMIPAFYFGFCWMFAIPLIADKGLAFWPAMRVSRRVVLRHPWRVSWLITVAGVVALAGSLAFFVGIVVTLPIYFGMLMFFYDEVFRTPGSLSAIRDASPHR